MSGNEVTIVVKSRNETQPGFASVRDDAKKLGDDSGDRFHKSFVSRIAGSASQIPLKLAESLTQGIKFASDNAKPLLVGGIVGAAPLIASAMSGAIIGGAGVGGVVGGIMLVKDDPRVIGAFDGFTSRLQTRLKTAATPFVDTTVKGIGQIEGALKSVNFEGILGKASTFVQPLAAGVANMIKDLGAGFGSLVQNAGPVIDKISHGLSQIGKAAGDGLQSLSDNADDAANSLGTLFDTVSTGTTITFGLINGLTEIKAKFDDAAGGIFAFDSGLKILNKIFGDTGNGTTWVDPVENFNNAVANGITTVDQYGNAITTAGQSLGDMAAAAQDAYDATHNLFDAETNVEEALDNVTESVKKNGRSLDVHTEKGRANRTALSHLAGALNAQYEASVKVNGVGKISDEVASNNYTSFIKSARGLGISAAAARKLAGDLGLIPPKKDTKTNVNTHDAEARIAALQAKLKALRDKYITVHVTTVGSASGYQKDNADDPRKGKNAHGGVRGAASGGTQNGLTWVGEEGPELVDLPTGSNVHTAGDSRRMAGGWGGGSGDVYLTYTPSGDVGIDAFVTNWVLPRLQRTNRNRYGNNATKMLEG